MQMESEEKVMPDDIATDKTKKYDRQLRLWGDHGQAALEGAKVCLVNATATGTEILKNIILPGIGSFTIVDGNKVSGEDIGNNFFLDKDSIGKSRAQIATEMLMELNEDVGGDYIEETVDNLLEHNQVFFSNFNIVIVTDLTESSLLRLAAHLWDVDVPLMVCRSYGMIGYLRLVLREHTVVESHPDNALADLRLDRPFTSLDQHCTEYDLSTMSKKDHSHTPWLVIIYKYLMKWKEQHDGLGPSNYSQKVELREMIRDGILKTAEGVPEDEENFDEAIRNINTALVPTKIPSSVQEIFNDENCQCLHAESSPFWILARAVKEFVENEGQGALPLRGSIPDMTADSSRYIGLQGVYKSRASDDVSVVTGYVHQLLHTLGRDEPLTRESWSPSSSPRKPQDNISDVDIKTFCKNAHFLRVVRTRCLADEYGHVTAQLSEITTQLEDTDENDLVYYVLLRAVDRFRTEYSKFPGYYRDSMEADIPKLKVCLSKMLQDWGVSQLVKDEYVHECCRYGAAELHSVAAFMGGTAAQEVIKVVTHQFVPINNTYIYNAMRQTSITVKL